MIPGLLLLAVSAGAVLYGSRHRLRNLDWLMVRHASPGATRRVPRRTGRWESVVTYRRTQTYRLVRGKVTLVGPIPRSPAPVARIWQTETRWATRLIEPIGSGKSSALRSIQYWPTEERAMRRTEEMLRNADLRAKHAARSTAPRPVSS